MNHGRNPPAPHPSKHAARQLRTGKTAPAQARQVTRVSSLAASSVSDSDLQPLLRNLGQKTAELLAIVANIERLATSQRAVARFGEAALSPERSSSAGGRHVDQRPPELGENTVLIQTSCGAHIQAVLRCMGAWWVVGCGFDLATVKHCQGLVYLRELIRHPYRPVSVLDLARLSTPVPEGNAELRPRSSEPAGQAVTLDRHAMGAYRSRLREIRLERVEAEQRSDLGRLEALRAEEEWLLKELWRARTQARRIPAVERARSATHKAIRRALSRIALAHPALADFLRCTVRCAVFCEYHPPVMLKDLVVWDTGQDHSPRSGS